VYAVFIFYLSSLSAPPGPPELGFLYGLVDYIEDLGLKFLLYPFFLAYRYPDKVAHVLLYMGFGLLLTAALSSSRNELLSKYAAPFSLLIGTLYGVTDEFHQVFVPYRSASSMDLFADFIGLLLAQLLILIYYGIKRRLKSKSMLAAKPFDLGLVLLFAFLAYLFVIVPPFNQTPLRIFFTLLILLFLPGYVLIAAMFPRKEELTGIERFTLSIGLSIAIYVFDGFAISGTAWRFRPEPIILSLSLILLILTLITFLVRLRIPRDEQFYFDFSMFLKFFESLRSDEKPSDIEKALIIALVGSIIIASGMLIYAKVTFEEEKFTAFYILGEGGKAEDYQKEVYLLEPSPMTVGIENYEHAPANYTLEVKLGGYPVYKQQIHIPAHGGKWKEKIFFTPKHVAKHVKLEFILYKDGSPNPYRRVHLWVDSLIDYDNLARIKKYALSVLPVIKNPDMESNLNWTFSENTKYFRGHFTKFYRLDENATVCGYVTNNITKKSIPGARVSVNNHYGYEKSNTTNESGYYEIKTIADHFWMSSTANGYKRNDTEFDISGGQTLVVNLTNAPIMAFNKTLEELSIINETIANLSTEKLPKEVSTIKGYVIDEVTGLPIANAHVIVRNEYGFERQTTTNESGYYEVNTISGRSNIDVRASGYALNTTAVVIASVHTVNPKLKPARSDVKGHIYDNTTDAAAISGAYIRVSGEGYSNTTRSNETGYYEVKTVAGHIQLDVSKEGYFSNGTEFNISYGEERTIDMVIAPIPPLPPPSTIGGYVWYNDTRLPGVKVVVSDHEGYEKSTLTDSNGYFEMEVHPGHLWLDVLPSVYMDSEVEFSIKSGQKATLDIELEAFPVSTYQIEYPSATPVKKGYYGGIYQDVESEEGVAALSFKVSDSYRANRSEGYLFKQVLLNDLVVWEDDVAENEGWQTVEIPVTFDEGTNRLALRVYAKQDSSSFPVTVWWDDVRIKPLEEITKEVATNFYVLDANGTKENYPTELYLGEPAEAIVGIENNEHAPVSYILQVKLGGDLLMSENIKVEEGSKWEQKISFVPNQIGSLLKLEFLLFKDDVKEKPYKSFSLWVSSDIDYNNLDLAVLKNYVVSPAPSIINGDMESFVGWTYNETDINFTGEFTNLTFFSPMYSYELSYPAETPFSPGCYAGMYQNFTVETLPATVVISFNVRDSYTSDEKGYFLKQVLLNGEVIWEDDVAENARWQHVKVPVTLHSTTNKLMFRVYGARGSEDYPVKVWWDDVKIEPVTEIAGRIATSFYILDAEGGEENYPDRLNLGEPAEFLMRIENNEHEEVNYIMQIKLDGRVLKTESKWLKHDAQWEQKIQFTSDRIGENQKLEFLLFKNRVKDKPYRYFQLGVSTAVNYDNLESLLEYGIESLPTIKSGDMRQISAWSRNYNGSFRGSYSTKNTSSPYSYDIEQYGSLEKGECGELWQNINAAEPGFVVLSFNVRDSFEGTSEDAGNISKQVMLNDEVIWEDDVSGRDTGYVGWVEEEYNWIEDKWEIKDVPDVKSGWMHVDVPVYLFKGDNKLRLRVYAEEDIEYLNVDVYWDDVELKRINELVKGERMRRYGW